MARASLGVAPSRTDDEVTVEWVRSEYPSYGTSITAPSDFVLDLPANPVDHQMELYEVLATNPITVIIPPGVLFTYGNFPTTFIDANRSGFFGFRYSALKSAWFLLTAAVQI